MSDRAKNTKGVAAVLIASLPMAACVTPQHDEMLCWQQYGQYFCTPLTAMAEYPAWIPSDDATVFPAAPRGARIVRPHERASEPRDVSISAGGGQASIAQTSTVAGGSEVVAISAANGEASIAQTRNSDEDGGTNETTSVSAANGEASIAQTRTSDGSIEAVAVSAAGGVTSITTLP